ncbi:MAG: NADH-quinone oxidoreductase subunit 15 [Trueperaceae bacterium]|nr:NADH-quinone oxidoreductase subunit 15 [Trueperaceae bacterium]
MSVSERDLAFYRAWATLLEWLRAEADERAEVDLVKQADFPDYIYRMERPYDLPTIVMNVSLSRADAQPVLMVSASPRHSVFKEVVLHPFDSHVYRRLTLATDGEALVEGKRVFSRELLSHLVDTLVGHAPAPA